MGVEVLPELHEVAVGAYDRALALPEGQRPHSPCEFLVGDAFGERQPWSVDPLGSATVLFCYSTAWKTYDGLHLPKEVSGPLAQRMRRDAVVITTDKVLPSPEFEVFKAVSVPNEEVGGSTAYFTRLAPLSAPPPSASERDADDLDEWLATLSRRPESWGK